MRKYPERAKRAPPDTHVPRLQYVYKLTMSHKANITEAAADYARHPDVEYAQPNYIATTQKGTTVPP